MPIMPAYRLVIKPYFLLKCCFTMLGSSTLPSAMAMPNSSVPPKSATWKGSERTAMPKASRPIATATVEARPKRRVISGVSVDTAPKARSGKVVNRPTCELPNPMVSRMVAAKGPTAARAGRRFTATNKMPTARRTSLDREEADGESDRRDMEVQRGQPMRPPSGRR